MSCEEKVADLKGDRNQQPVEDDGWLLNDLRRGHSPALDELSRRYRARIVRLAARYVRDSSDAEDLAQEVLLKVWRHVAAFEGNTRLWPWIARITINASISHLRTRQRLATEPLPAGTESEGLRGREPFSDAGMRADDQAVLAEFRACAARALRGLPAVYRRAVTLMDIHQCSTREASRCLGVPIPTVKSRAIRGRRLLRQALASFAGGLGVQENTSCRMV